MIDVEHADGGRPLWVSHDRGDLARAGGERGCSVTRLGQPHQHAGRDRQQRHMLSSVLVDRAHQLVGTGDRVRGHAEIPLGESELGLGRVQRTQGLAGPGVEVPPVGPVREQEQPVVPPARLNSGLVGPAGNPLRVVDTAVDQVADHDRRRVPRHVRVVPLGPGQPSGRGELRRRVEVGARAQHLAAVDVVAVQAERDDRVHRFAAAAVVFADRQHQIPVGMHPQIAVPKIIPRGDRIRRPVVGDHPHPAVGQLADHDDAVADVVLAAAVLVHPVPHVRRCRGDLERLAAAQRTAPQAGAAGLFGVRLQPVEVVAVDADSAEADRTLGEGIDGDRRRPGPVGGNGHGVTVKTPTLRRGLGVSMVQNGARQHNIDSPKRRRY